MGNSQSGEGGAGNRGGAAAAGASQAQLPRSVVINSTYWLQHVSPENVQQRVAIKPASAYGINLGGGGGGGDYPAATPLTELNGWPEKLANQDIIPLLLDGRHLSELGFDEEFIKFGEFVREWYSCSCAVVYNSPTDSMIIGSGNYVRDLTVSTARHVYDELDDSQLSVRFFKYNIRPSVGVGLKPRVVLVRQDYIDVPVIGREHGSSGLDAGFLKLEPSAQEEVADYSKALPCPSLNPHSRPHSTSVSNMLRGVYALFHFAEGSPLVSVGRVDAAPAGASLIRSVIDVHAGPGSSGGAAIAKYGSRISGEAVHSYRKTGDEYDNRVFIDFVKIVTPGHYNDDEAPYKEDNQLALFNDKLCREYIKHDPSIHIGRRKEHKFTCPSVPEYGYTRGDGPSAPAGSLQRHHIIPIDDMIYLYEYFSGLDKKSYEEIERQAIKEEQSQAKKQCAGLTKTPNFRADMGATQEEKKPLQNALFVKHYTKEVVSLYGPFHHLITSLTPGKREYRVFVAEGEIKAAHENVLYFSYAFWNLFQGYRERADDPKNDGTTDYSEKIKPRSFDKTLWDLLKHEKTGLYIRLKKLQEASGKGERDKKVMRKEKEVYESLENILKTTRGPGVVHRFVKSDWEDASQRRKQLRRS